MKQFFLKATDWPGLPAPVKSYLKGEALWNGYLPPRTSLKADIERVLQSRTFPEEARRTLVSVIKKQKSGQTAALTLASRLENPDCFTVTTGHQPVLMGGPLFFWYKILGVITLAARCRQWFPEYDFVPVFWLAGEDHDLAEVFTFYGPDERFHRFIPEDDYAGAAGRYPSAPIHAWLIREVAVQPLYTAQPWFPLFDRYYRKGPSLADATLAILDELFAGAGLLTLNPDDAELKRAFTPFFEKELKTSYIQKGLRNSADFFAKQGFRVQIQGREVNLFLLDTARRWPLEKVSAGTFRAGDKALSLDELLNQPENLSPNVALRPVYQEAVLPSVAYVGGPAEVHYWLQLKPVFDEARLPMPVPVLRPLVAWLPESCSIVLEKSGLNPEDLFKPVDEQLRRLAGRAEYASAALRSEAEAVRAALLRMREMLSLADSSLEKSADAALTRFEHTLKRLEHLGFRAWKKRHAEWVALVHRLHQRLYPRGMMQERLWSIWNVAFLQDVKALLRVFETVQEEHLHLFFGEKLS